MKSGTIKYSFTAKPWQYTGSGAWYFVSLPKGMSSEIRKNLGSEEEGWGRLKATAVIGGSEWQTAIWFDTKRKTYLLPLKAIIRKKENILADKKVPVVIRI